MTTTRRPRARRGQGELLREEILGAARELMAETGDEAAVSVRAVADRVGVSTPSIYLHFSDKQALLDAVCEESFTELADYMAAHVVDPESSFDELRQRGMAYVRFGLAHPEQYRIMMMAKRGPLIGDEVSRDVLVAGEAFGHFFDTIERCVRDGYFVAASDGSPPDPFLIGLSLWSAAHGITSLLVAKPHFPWPDVEQLIDTAIRSCGLGMAALGRVQGCDPAELLPALQRM